MTGSNRVTLPDERGVDPVRLSPASFERLSQLAGVGLDLRPELYVDFESKRPACEKILETAAKLLRAHLIIMGLHGSAHAGVIYHLDLTTTYEAVCGAGSPVLTIGCRSGHDLRPRAAEVAA